MIVLHIGHGKTGTSALQSFLAANVGLLREYGIEYPRDNNFENARKGLISSGNRRAFTDIKAFRDDTDYLFSNEGFMREFLVGGEVFEKIKANRDGISKIIIYTRDLFEHCMSSWGQQLKRNGITEDPSSFASRFRLYNRVLRVISQIEELGITCSIYNYSRHKKAIERHFLSVLLPDLTADAFERFEKIEIRVNRSLTMSEYEFQRQANLMFEHRTSRFFADPLVNNLPEVTPDTPTITPEAAVALTENNRADAERLNAIIGPDEAVSCEVPAQSITAQTAEDFTFSKPQLEQLIAGVRSLVGTYERRALTEANIATVRSLAERVRDGDALTEKDAAALDALIPRGRANSA